MHIDEQKQARTRLMKSAHVQVSQAVKAGKLTRPDTCELCSNTKGRIVAHHWNGHQEPLDIWWVCNSCNIKLQGDTFHSGTVTRDEARKHVTHPRYTVQHAPRPKAKAPKVSRHYRSAVRFRVKELMGEYRYSTGKKLSYRRLAGQTGISKTSICRIANNDVIDIQLDTIKQLLLFFDIGIGDLMYIDPPTTTTQPAVDQGGDRRRP